MNLSEDDRMRSIVRLGGELADNFHARIEALRAAISIAAEDEAPTTTIARAEVYLGFLRGPKPGN